MAVHPNDNLDGALWVHVPFPNDHYSPATGSAAMAVVYELNRQHLQRGGRAQVIVGRGTRHDYPVGECIEVEYPAHPNRKQKLIDAGLSRLRFPRVFENAIYRAASEAIPGDFEGPIFVNNAPGSLRLFKDQHPSAQVCLYAVNALFRTYNRSEVRRTLAAADCVVCCSHYIANDLEMRLGASSPKIQVVHNGVDTDLFRPLKEADRAEFSEAESDEEVPTILFVGRAVPEKGPDLLLRAAGKLLQAQGKNQRRFKLRIVGSAGFAPSVRLSSYEEELRRLAQPLGQNVEFQASVDRVQLLREYQGASIFCAPSNWDDPFPLTVLEAMSCGLPVVASQRGGIPEAGGEDIMYFQPPEVDELAAHLAALIDDPALRRSWGGRARERVQRFAWSNQYLQLRQALKATSCVRDGAEKRVLAAPGSNSGMSMLSMASMMGWLG
jgi:glycosyltransferase involved in cell wall biosynthesis